MKKKRLVFLASLTVLITVSILVACSKGSNVENSIKGDPDESIHDVHARSIPAEIIELEKMKNEIARRIVGGGISKSFLIKSIETNDMDRVKKAIGMTDHEYEEKSLNLLNLKQKILDKYPKVVTEYNLLKECKSCNLEKMSLFLAKIADKTSQNQDVITQASLKGNADIKSNQSLVIDEEGGCDWVKVTACLLVCTSTGPILY